MYLTTRYRWHRSHAALALLTFVAISPAQTTISIDVTANRHTISPQIYGAAFATTAQAKDLNLSVSRFGGNEASSYNWEQNCAAKGADWYFESWANDSSSTAGEAVDSFVSSIFSAGTQPMVTVPMLNYVGIVGPTRQTLWSYSVAKYRAQTGGDPYNSDAGNGISSATNQPITTNDPTDANTANSLTMQQAWFNHMISNWGTSNAGGVKYYLMDNEPSIWHASHQDVHPVGETYDEIYQDYVTYGGALRATDPNVTIFGPEEWGWEGYFYSGYDQQYAANHGFNGVYPDSAAHNNMQYIPWLLQSLQNYQNTNGVRLLDVLSVHYYPQQGEDSGDDSSTMQTIRNRSTRSLWDPNYTDTSWINSVVMLIPRLKNWVSTYYPGLKTAMTEYNWGDDTAMNGGTAQADVLGICGREGLDFASRWVTPDTNTPAYLGMKIYRNYDGNNSGFGDTSVSCSTPNPDNVAAFAAQRSSDGSLTVMLINKLTSSQNVTLDVSGFGTQSSANSWQFSSTNSSSITQLSGSQVSLSAIQLTLPAQSVTMYVVAPSTESISGLSLNPSTVAGGSNSTGTVTLSVPAPSGGYSVNLTSQSSYYVGVPTTVTVPAGSTTATFNITTKPYTSNYTNLIKASDAKTSQTATLTVDGDSVKALSLSPTSVTGGQTSTGTVTLSAAAPTGGWPVTLTTQSSYYVSVPSSVTVPAGSTSVTFTATTREYSSTYTNVIQAADTLTHQRATLTVNCDSVSGLSLNPSSVSGGQGSTGTVTLTVAAPAGGWTVNLTSQNVGYVKVPTSITVPAGSTSSTFAITTVPYSATFTNVIQAADTTTHQRATLTVNCSSVTGLTLNPSTVTGGQNSTGTVTLSANAPAGGWTVNLTSQSPSYVSVPGSVTVPAGSRTVNFTITTKSYTSTYTNVIQAADTTTHQRATLTVTP